MNLVQKALRAGEETLDSLESKFAIKVKRHPEHPELVMLKYNQILSPMDNPLVQQCRGLILDESRNYEVVSWPFHKFFNESEPLAANIDWNTAKVLEKLDGSLMTLYWYDNKWQVASSGTPDAGGPVHASDTTFAALFWATWKELGYSFSVLSGHMTYMFELMTEHNHVVVRHTKPRLVLLGARGKISGLELDVTCTNFEFQEWFEVVKSYPLTSLEETKRSLEVIDGLYQEGYVVVDSAFNRIKIKHPKYVFAHQLKETLTDKNLLDTIRRGEEAEVLSYFPELDLRVNELKARYLALCSDTSLKYMELKGWESQKVFAGEALKTKYSSALFALRNKKCLSTEEYYAGVHIDTLMKFLEGLDK